VAAMQAGGGGGTVGGRQRQWKLGAASSTQGWMLPMQQPVHISQPRATAGGNMEETKKCGKKGLPAWAETNDTSPHPSPQFPGC
jgi:hypothetical protein